jgi:hypothetical protein
MIFTLHEQKQMILRCAYLQESTRNGREMTKDEWEILLMTAKGLLFLFMFAIYEKSVMRFSKRISSCESQLSSHSVPFHPVLLLSNVNLTHTCNKVLILPMLKALDYSYVIHHIGQFKSVVFL